MTVLVRITLAGLRARRMRLASTMCAIVLGVGFVAGTLIFGDTARSAVYDGLARSGRNVDVAVLPAAATGSTQAPEGATVPAGTIAAVRAVPGVAAASGRLRRVLPLLNRHGRLVDNAGHPGVGVDVGDAQRLRPYDLVSGRLPAGPGEAALETNTVGWSGYRVGEQITVLDAGQGSHQLTLVGIVDFGSAKELADQTVVVLDRAQLVALTGQDGDDQVVVAAAPGVDPGALATRVRAALPAGVRVQTGDRYRTDLAKAAVQQLDQFLLVLRLFAGIACVVAAFVIYNTFTILLAQRVRETALLRCVGADRRQVFGTVLLESLLLGVAGAALGIGVGVAVAAGLVRGASGTGLPLPDHPLVFTARSVLVGLGVGVLATVLSALVPAVRATRVPPLAALGAVQLAGPRGRGGRVLLVVAALLAGAAGTALTVAGSASNDFSQRAALMVVAGGLINFLAMLIVSPLVIGPLVAVLGWLPARLLGPTARLAVANVRRVPGRAAATTAALMIGIGLMSAAGVATATVRATADRQLAEHYPVDYLLQPAQGTGTDIPQAVARQLRADQRIGLVATVRTQQVTASAAAARDAGVPLVAAAVDPVGVAALPAPTLSSGSMANFRDGTAVVYTGSPVAGARRVGDRLRLAAGDRVVTLTVVGVAPGYPVAGDLLVTWSDLATLRPTGGDSLVLVRAAAGVGLADSRAAVTAATEPWPLVNTGSIAAARSQLTEVVDTLIAIIATLLGFAIVIALIGITNTLSLSVLERTRESATVRALGLTRGQLRATLLIEAVLMAVAGAGVGVGFGVLYGWLTTRVLFAGFTVVMTVPVWDLAGYVGLAAAAGAAAALLPARAAARASVVAAMADA